MRDGRGLSTSFDHCARGASSTRNKEYEEKMFVAADLKDCPSIMWDDIVRIITSRKYAVIFRHCHKHSSHIARERGASSFDVQADNNNILRGEGPNIGVMGRRERQNHRDMNLHGAYLGSL